MKTNVATLKSTRSTALNQCSFHQGWHYVVRPPEIEDRSCRRIDDGLRTMELVVRQAGQRPIAVVQPTKHQWDDQQFVGGQRQALTYCPQLSQSSKTRRRCFQYLCASGPLTDTVNATGCDIWLLFNIWLTCVERMQVRVLSHTGFEAHPLITFHRHSKNIITSALVNSWLDYTNSLMYNTSSVNMLKLQRVQN